MRDSALTKDKWLELLCYLSRIVGALLFIYFGVSRQPKMFPYAYLFLLASWWALWYWKGRKE